MRTLLTLLALAAPSLALGQAEPPPDRPVRYQAVTILDFQGIEFDVPVDRPAIANISEVRIQQLPPMFQLRKSFDQEMDESVDQIK